MPERRGRGRLSGSRWVVPVLYWSIVFPQVGFVAPSVRVAMTARGPSRGWRRVLWGSRTRTLVLVVSGVVVAGAGITYLRSRCVYAEHKLSGLLVPGMSDETNGLVYSAIGVSFTANYILRSLQVYTV